MASSFLRFDTALTSLSSSVHNSNIDIVLNSYKSKKNISFSSIDDPQVQFLVIMYAIDYL